MRLLDRIVVTVNSFRHSLGEMRSLRGLNGLARPWRLGSFGVGQGMTCHGCTDSCRKLSACFDNHSAITDATLKRQEGAMVACGGFGYIVAAIHVFWKVARVLTITDAGSCQMTWCWSHFRQRSGKRDGFAVGIAQITGRTGNLKQE